MDDIVPRCRLEDNIIYRENLELVNGNSSQIIPEGSSTVLVLLKKWH
jgi:hypothetical protein